MSELMSITKEIFYPHFLCLVRQLNEHDPWEYLAPVNFLNEIYEGCPEEIITCIKEKFPIFFDFLIKPTVELSDPPVARRNYKNDDDVNTSLTNDSHVFDRKRVSGKKNVFESITVSRTEVPGKRKVFVKNDDKMVKRVCMVKGIASGVRVKDYGVMTADNEDDPAKKVSHYTINEDDHAKKAYHYTISNSQTKKNCPESKDKTGKMSVSEIISPKGVEAGKRSNNIQFPQNDNMNTMTLEVLQAQLQWLNQISEEELEILRRKFRQQVHFSEDIWSSALDLASIAMDSYDNDDDIECNEWNDLNVDPNVDDYDMIRVDDIVEKDEIDDRVDDKMSDEINDTNSIGLSDELDDDVNNNILDNDDVNNNILDNAYMVDSVEGVLINFCELDGMADNFDNDDNDCFPVTAAPEFCAKPLECDNNSLCILDNKDSDMTTSDFGGQVMKVIVGELAKGNGTMIKEMKRVKMKLSAKKNKIVNMRLMKFNGELAKGNGSMIKKMIRVKIRSKRGIIRRKVKLGMKMIRKMKLSAKKNKKVKMIRKMKLSAKKNKKVKMRMMKLKRWIDSKRLIKKRLKRKRLKAKVGCLRIDDQYNKIKQTNNRQSNIMSTTQQNPEIEDFALQAQINQLMNLIVNTFYLNKEVIFNASNASVKICYLSLTDKTVLNSCLDLKFDIYTDTTVKILAIRDTCIGIAKLDLVNNLGTIACSGSKAFTQAVLDGVKDINMIGQFGVGFYSAYLVSNKVTAVTKHNYDKQYIWESEAEEHFMIQCDNHRDFQGCGSKNILLLNEEQSNFLKEKTIKDLIKIHSQFIQYPISLQITKDAEKKKKETPKKNKETIKKKKVEKNRWEVLNKPKPLWLWNLIDVSKKKVEKKGWERLNKPKPLWLGNPIDVSKEKVEKKGWERLNKPKPLWLRNLIDVSKKKVEKKGWERLNKTKPLWLQNPIDLSKEEFNTVYKFLSNDWEEHLAAKHFSVEDQPIFHAVLFFPKCAPFDMLNNRKNPNSIKLYVCRVFIMDNCEELVPKWLYIIKGLVGSVDLPLNISCESLQQYKILKVIYQNIGKTIIELFTGIADIKEFYVASNMNHKYGIHNECTNRNILVEFLLFYSTKSGSVMTFLLDYHPHKKDTGIHLLCLYSQLCSPIWDASMVPCPCVPYILPIFSCNGSTFWQLGIF